MVDRLVEQPEARVSGRDPSPGLLHTPYDGSSKPFTAGLTPLDPRRWLESRSGLAAVLAERERLLAGERQNVFQEEAGSRTGQAEALSLIAAHLTADHPQTWRREGAGMAILPSARAIALDGEDPPLMTAGRMVSEDLVLMQPGPDGFRLTAAMLCFPSSWSLAEKFGQSLDAIHAQVPGYRADLAAMTQRIFERLRPGQIVERTNWSIYADRELRHPAPQPKPPRWPLSAEEACIRVERQTLRRLPQTGAALFTIGVHVHSFGAFRHRPDGHKLAASLRAQLLALTPAQAAYKGLADSRDRLAAILADLGARR